MGADRNTVVSRLFGVYNEDNGLPLRGTFIVSPEGKLMSAEVAFYNAGRNVDELLRKFKANLYLSKHPKEGCPSKWKDEGDKTLTPGPQMVGRVADSM
ncbi:MAG: Alkyl hydroperoxide reductase C [Planctomycetes bacterium]|nr:Alkyl hydroperoxide reductase C [Planctomycetota bacterium]